MNHAELTSLLYQALDAQFGLVVTTNNSALLKQKLYAARSKEKATVGDIFAALKFRTSPEAPDTELWLVNTTTKQETPDAKES